MPWRGVLSSRTRQAERQHRVESCFHGWLLAYGFDTWFHCLLLLWSGHTVLESACGLPQSRSPKHERKFEELTRVDLIDLSLNFIGLTPAA